MKQTENFPPFQVVLGAYGGFVGQMGGRETAPFTTNIQLGGLFMMRKPLHQDNEALYNFSSSMLRKKAYQGVVWWNNQRIFFTMRPNTFAPLRAFTLLELVPFGRMEKWPLFMNPKLSINVILLRE